MELCRVCIKCKETKNRYMFHKNKRPPLFIQNICISCRKFIDKEQRQKHKLRISKSKKKYADNIRIKILEFLNTKSCVDCGETNLIVLEFDHVRGDKLYNISGVKHGQHSLKVVFSEIEKCEVRCGNCHRLKTAKERNYKVYNYFYGDQV